MFDRTEIIVGLRLAQPSLRGGRRIKRGRRAACDGLGNRPRRAVRKGEIINAEVAEDAVRAP